MKKLLRFYVCGHTTNKGITNRCTPIHTAMLVFVFVASLHFTQKRSPQYVRVSGALAEQRKKIWQEFLVLNAHVVEKFMKGLRALVLSLLILGFHNLKILERMAKLEKTFAIIPTKTERIILLGLLSKFQSMKYLNQLCGEFGYRLVKKVMNII